MEKPITILLVEDDNGAIKSIERTLKEVFGDVIRIEIKRKFAEAVSFIEEMGEIESVILDLYVDDDLEGQKVWDIIWKTGLIPILIHTAREWEYLDPPLPESHPFLQGIKKGSGSDLAVAEKLQELMPYIMALRELKDETRRVINSVIEGAAPAIWPYMEDGAHPELLVRCARRRLAAMMDMETILSGEALYGWEQFVYPPLEGDLLLGDLLFEMDSDPGDPKSYRLILTPSCDMQVNNGKRKVEKILVAMCDSISKYVDNVQADKHVKPKDLKDGLARYLNEPHISGYIPIPGFSKIIPPMAACIRDLELIPVDEISLEKDKENHYLRIASTDSPFREQISWAYMQIAGRLGLPDREYEKWADDIMASLPEPE